MSKLVQEAGYWVIGLDGGAIGVTFFSLVMLVVQLVLVGEPYRRGHTILLVAALLGFVVHVFTSRMLMAARNVTGRG